jgi:hypothetical protein
MHVLQTCRYQATWRAVPTTDNPHCKNTMTENSKQIFPEMKLRGFVPKSYIHVSVSDLYVPTIGLQTCLCRKIGGPIMGIYKSLTDT